MKIAVVGLTGRMSKVIIEEITKLANCQLVGILVRNKSNHQHDALYESIEELSYSADAIIDFSNPATSLKISKKLANTKTIHVCGTTGFTEEEFETFKMSAQELTTIYSPNMSIGINLINSTLKNILHSFGNECEAAIIDIHHKHKKDSPSGTALNIAQTIKENSSIVPQISSIRIGEVPGEHSIILSNNDESITITHHAFNRKIFAHGAIKACFWAKDKPCGLYSMQDVLKS